MAAEFTAEEILEICSGRLAQGLLPDGAGRIATDTRQLERGDWYLALCGERFDGHDFIGDAFAGGATGCIVAERPSYPLGNQSFPLIAVPDTLRAYHDLARNWRRRINPLVVGITGSSGKTTTKEMCAAAMSVGLATHKSAANENNEYGVPRTILSMPEDCRCLVVEMAMRGLGQIALLAATAEPDIGIIVNAGVAHLELLGTVDNIISAKCELFEHLRPGRSLGIIGNPTEALVAKASQVCRAPLVLFSRERCLEDGAAGDITRFRCLPEPELVPLRGSGGAVSADTVFSVRARGLPHLQDAWCAVTAARAAGLADADIASGLSAYEPPPGRGNKLTTAGGALIIDESYNANPDSVMVSIGALLDERADERPTKIVVLGDLAELGEESERLHRDLGLWLKDKPLSALVTVGERARLIADGASGAGFDVIVCDSRQGAERILRPRLDRSASILIKGSHSARLDELVAALLSAAV